MPGKDTAGVYTDWEVNLHKTGHGEVFLSLKKMTLQLVKNVNILLVFLFHSALPSYSLLLVAHHRTTHVNRSYQSYKAVFKDPQVRSALCDCGCEYICVCVRRLQMVVLFEGAAD